MPKRGSSNTYSRNIECKIGLDAKQQAAAVAQAGKWIEDAYCETAIALCYPPAIARADDIPTALATTDGLKFAVIRANDSGHPLPTTPGDWQTGNIATLGRYIRDAPITGGARIAHEMGRGVKAWCDNLPEGIQARLATTMQTPSADNATAICGLLLVNMCMLHENLADPVKQQHHRHSNLQALRNLHSLQQIETRARQAKASVHQGLTEDWNLIRSVDFAPIADPAISILEHLDSPSVQDHLIGLLRTAVACAPLLSRTQLDYAGPLYHGLLQSRFDGSFYTSTAAAVILTELAIHEDWCDWSDWRDIARRRICDPACGTGTLLMATQKVLLDRFRAATNGHKAEDEIELQRALIEKSLIGLDINAHAIHLAACMLTLANHERTYRQMQLHCMQHGTVKGKTRCGSLEILVGDEQTLTNLGLPKPAQQQGGTGTLDLETHEIAQEDMVDLVVMNPPYTRGDILNHHLPEKVKKAVQKRKNKIATNAPVQYQKSIHSSSIGTYFTPIADHLLRPEDGICASVKPFTFCTNQAGFHERKLLQQNYHIQYVITGHDNANLAFSGKTKIHESLIIARRRGPHDAGGPTHFISLTRNPTSTVEAHELADAIRCAASGNITKLVGHGTIHAVPHNTMQAAEYWPWPTLVHQPLADEYHEQLLHHPNFVPLGRFAQLRAQTSSIHTNFHGMKPNPPKQTPSYHILWNHKTDRQNTLLTSPNEHMHTKLNHEDRCAKLWHQRTPLLIADRWQPSTVRTPAVICDPMTLSSAFLPIFLPNQPETHYPAYAVWFNSTPGLLALLVNRSRKLTYTRYRNQVLLALPVPPPDLDLSPLTAVYEEYKNAEIQRLPAIDRDPIRIQFDNAVCQVLPHLTEHLPRWRERIAAEPTVHGLRRDDPQVQNLI